MRSLSSARFLANLRQCRGWIPDAKSANVVFLVIVTFCLTKTENRTRKSLTQLWHYCFEHRYFFGQKTLIFCKKNAGISKSKRAEALKVYFLKLHMGVYLRAKFEVYSIILTSFREGIVLPPPPSKRTPKKPTQIRVNFHLIKAFLKIM